MVFSWVNRIEAFMKVIQNTTLQGFNIPFNTPNGIVDIYLRPKKAVVVPLSYSSQILNTLIKRKQIRVTKVGQ